MEEEEDVDGGGAAAKGSEGEGGATAALAPKRRASLGGQQTGVQLTHGGTARTNTGMGALMRQFATAAVGQERSVSSSRRPSMARLKEAASTDDVRRLEELISDMQQIQMVQFESISLKMEEVLSNMYV